MKKYIYFLFFSFLLSLSVVTSRAQNVQGSGSIIESIERYEPNQGRVRIHQDPRISQLIGSKRVAGTERGTYTTIGYRIQIYSGNNSRESRAEAQRLASKVKEYLPDQKVYTYFNSPRWVCKVGDFKSIEEADRVMRELKKTGVFKETTISRNEQITVSL